MNRDPNQSEIAREEDRIRLAKSAAKSAAVIAQTRRVWVQMVRKYNIGNYESLTISVGMSRDLKDEETINGAIIKAKKLLAKRLGKPAVPDEAAVHKGSGHFSEDDVPF